MKDKTSDEKVYETLCQIFDDFMGKFTEQIPFGTFDTILQGIKYAEDYDKNKTNRDIWYGMVNDWQSSRPDEFKEKYVIAVKPRREFIYRSNRFIPQKAREVIPIAINIDDYSCLFTLKDLPHYINAFHKLSKHRGKHLIPEEKQLNERGKGFMEESMQTAAIKVAALSAAITA